MTKKKLFSLLLTVCMLFTLFTACNSSDEDNSSKGDVVSDIVSDGKEVVSDMESGGKEVVSGMESMLPGDQSEAASKKNLSSDASAEASLALSTIANPMTGKPIDERSLSAVDNQSKGWGQGKEVDGENRPVSCLSFQEKYENLNASFIEKNQQNIYLTFDEGYENGYTAQILDTLKEKKCPAVFFVTMPYVKQNPDLVKRMIAEGHIVGNHTVNHPSLPAVSLEEAANEINELHAYVKETFLYDMTVFRPPMGEWSERTLALTKLLGYKSIFWSFAYKDWIPDEQPDPEAALKKITNAVHGGAIYLLHAVSSTNTTILPDFIDAVRAKGFTFERL